MVRDDDSGPGRILWRGATKRCPRCGAGHLFRGWFRIVDDCPNCGLHFERESGYWTGAMAINIGVVSLLFVIVLVAGLALTVPDVPVVPLLAITVPIMAIGPIVFYPFSKTIWMAVDRAFLPRIDR